jgi:hypothetical protein
MGAPTIKFLATANQTVVSEYSKALLKQLLAAANCMSCVVTSTSRTPQEQARVMYQNILIHGVEKQLALYAVAGDSVINEYVRLHQSGQAESTILTAMTAKIIEIGPQRVSKHCADPKEWNVLDIAPSSLASPARFEAQLNLAVKKKTVSRFFSPGSNDPAFHLEIPQPKS